ncbi:hypothetical protein PR003_g18045 [Phytophthora rubi]|uniref:Uncharacterized protein n=1 Tax=Phytophthora rubi TaxID=129364 RepID=A0A6A4EHM8_9STRA|nr:hypothetical protein PR002_g18578 [Phytophthora rubi]KAE9002174.1 hypothetical protein PR001_g18331 [Phytophthora rubi]KAE9319154.1 hypothetical protein PR003_g18045 [Phytophthora rubi]
MQYRVARAISRAVVAAGTAGAIVTACWLLNRILDDSEHKRIANAPTKINVDETFADDESDDEYDRTDSYQRRQVDADADDSFALLPVVSESDDESEDDAMGYTGDFFTPRYDVCMLAVSVQTQVDPLSDVPPVDASDCRLCRAATEGESCDSAAGQGYDLDEKPRALSFSETDSSSGGSVLSIASNTADVHDEESWKRRGRTCSRTEQWLYVRL